MANAAESIIVPFSDDETVREDELIVEDDKPAAGETPEQRKSRLENRRERASKRERERKQQEEELATVKAELAQQRERTARLEGYVTAPRPAQGEQADPYKKRLDQVRQRQESEWAAYQAELKAGTLTEARVKHYNDVSAEIEEAKIAIHTDRAIAARDAREVPARRQEQAQQIWVQKYPEVYQNQNAFSYAQARVQQRVALGEKHTNDLNDEVFQETMAQFKLGKKQAPSQTERARFSGVGSSGGGGGNGGDSRGVAITKDLRKMAVALHPELPEDEAVKKWTNTVGKSLREKKIL